MLSISKLRVGQEAYQLSGVAQSLDDYYTGAGEAAGQWAGTGATRLGLEGEVAPDDLRAVLAGIRPGTGGLDPNGEQIRPHARRVPGFDLTFKAPKSVSVLYAVTYDPRVQGAIIEAGEVAVRASLGWLEREAVKVRRGSGDKRWLADLALRDPEAAAVAGIRVLSGGGVVAAMFRHRTSRSGDPLLHWHTLVANLTEGPDGRWSALVTPDLHRAVRAAGEVFQTVLRDELTGSLGIEWRPGRHVPEVAGVPERLCEMFSKRSGEIEAWLDATGTPDDPAGRQAAVLATRRNKPEVEDGRFDAAWKSEAISAGWGPDVAQHLITSLIPGRTHPVEQWTLAGTDIDEYGRPYRFERVVDPEEWIADVLRRDLTSTGSTFTRAQLTQAVAARLTDGASMQVIERIVARVFASPLVVAVEGSDRRWTTTELLDVEGRFLAAIDPPVTFTSEGPHNPAAHHAVSVAAVDDRGVVLEGVLDDVLDTRPTLGADQAEAIRALAGPAAPVSVLVGPAGTGKTFTLDALRECFERTGMRVIGAAPSARAALELEAGAGIASVTLHRLLGRWARGEDAPSAGMLLVVDEAGMASIRDLEAVVSRVVNVGGRVVLAGDHHQLPEVGPGGGFAAAVERCDAVAELRVNRRQHEPWEQAALEQLRNGDIAHAVGAYRRHDRLVVADDPTDAIAQAVQRWRAAVQAGHRPVLLAGTTATVDALNQAVRASLIEDGTLTGEGVGVWSGKEFSVGDRVVLRTNSYLESDLTGGEVAVLNGQAAIVVAGDPGGLTLKVDTHTHPIRLDARYLAGGGIDHGYALTTHRAQGGTWDQAIAVGSDGLYREAAYVQLSRGRHTNVLILARNEADGLDAELIRHDHGLPLPDETTPNPIEDLAGQLHRSHARTLTLTNDPDAAHVHHLATTMTFPDIEAHAKFAREAEARARAIVGIDPEASRSTIDRARHTATHLTAGMQVKADDRHNIGTAMAVNDHDGTATVSFTSAYGTTATRVLGWDQLQIVTQHDSAEHPLTADAEEALERLTAPHQDAIESTRRLLAVDGLEPGDAHRWERAATSRVDAAAARLASESPIWITDTIGTRPAWPAAAQVWDDALRNTAAADLRGADRGLTDVLGASADWLGKHPAPATHEATSRPFDELARRREDLEALLDTAPPSQRNLIEQFRADVAEARPDTADLLVALSTQGEREAWILANWPHIVELQEVDRADDHPVAGSSVAEM